MPKLAAQEVPPADPTPLPPPYNPTTFTLALQQVANGLDLPVALTHADSSGRLFVAEKGGTIRIVQDGAVVATPFLDITPLVNSSGTEQGLLGLAFHPRYLENGFFYVHYSDLNGDTAIARYQVSADANVADPNTAAILLQIDQPYANHNGGHLLFGPDGYLYIGMGDGGSGGDPHGNGQNPAALLGKMLRIDVDGGFPYAIPWDNPFVDTAGARGEIWAMGLRNPWRYSFDRLTGDLYVADVGQNEYEEVNFAPIGASGLNYGWNRMEGSHCYRADDCDREGLVLPVGEYDHDDGCSITGGNVYRGSAYPALFGGYFFGDICSGKIWSLHRDAEGSWIQTELLESDAEISTFGEDANGELYLASMGEGAIYQVTAATP